MQEKLKNSLRKDQALIAALKANQMTRLLCSTDKGDLKILLRKNSQSYEFLLDQIPVSADDLTFLLPSIEHLFD